jgi:cell division protein FtsL
VSTARAARVPRRADAAEARAERVRRRAHLQVVDAPPPVPARRRSKAPAIVATCALVTVFLSLFGLVVFHTVLVQNQSEIDELDQQLGAEREQIEKRRLEIAELEAPERVIAVAESLGLIAPDEVVMLDPVPVEPDDAGTPGGVVAPVAGHEQAGAPTDGGATP